MDIVVSLTTHQVASFVAAFADDDYYVPPMEVLTVEIKRGQRGHCNVISHATGYKADIYIAFYELHRWAMAQTPVSPSSCGIGHCAQARAPREGGSNKHLRDIVSMLEVSSAIIDLQLIDHHVAHLGLRKEWQLASGRVV